MAKKLPIQEFLATIAAVCEAPRSTIRNTTVTPQFGEVFCAEYSTSLRGNGCKENNAPDFLKKLGFTSAYIPSTGGSSRGDFSTDVYGNNFKHENGATVSVRSDFRWGDARFRITVCCTLEQARAFEKASF